MFDWEGADVREMKLSVTPEGWLMASTVLRFVSQKLRFNDEAAHRDEPDAYIPNEITNRQDSKVYGYYQLEKPGIPSSDQEKLVDMQSVSWLSQDGVHWSSAHTCASGVNFWRWETTWYNGMGYSAGYREGGTPGNGTLFRTRDGKQWRTLSAGFYPKGLGNESTIAFDDNSTAYCLLRDAKLRGNPKGPSVKGGSLPMFGTGMDPYYTKWTWKDLLMDFGDGAGALPVEEVLLVPLGGPR